MWGKKIRQSSRSLEIDMIKVLPLLV